jgi:SAM-dependent methyltransferase
MEQQTSILKELYHKRFIENEGYRNKVWHILCSEFFSKYIDKNSRILDLGAGWGEFINNIFAGEKFAMDLNPGTKEHLGPGVKFIHQDCSQQWPFDTNSLDAVFTSNFLEHLPDKGSVQRTIAEAYRCLKKGGQIICLGPNIRFVSAEYWDFWDHQIPISDLSCMELLKIVGFHIERSIPRFLPYSMSTGGRPPLLLVKLYLYLPPLWKYLGKQFMIIGRK